jgi:hypothetical protein
MVNIKTTVSVLVALTIFFLLASVVILPYFSSAYRYTCSAYQWKPAAGGVTTNCTTLIVSANDSALTAGSSYTQEGVNSPTAAGLASSYCLDCTTQGSRATSTGMVLFVLLIGFIFVAVTFLRYITRSK